MEIIGGHIEHGNKIGFYRLWKYGTAMGNFGIWENALRRMMISVVLKKTLEEKKHSSECRLVCYICRHFVCVHLSIMISPLLSHAEVTFFLFNPHSSKNKGNV